MNKLFKYNRQHINNISNIFKLPVKICTTNTKYFNNRNNKNATNKNTTNKQIYIPKITFNNIKNNKKKPKKKVVPKTNLLKVKTKDKIKPISAPKETIPKRVRELVWTTYNGETFTHKCYVSWCDNNINVFNFQVGHDIPESKGGTIDIDNLKPICASCNLSMSNKYSITEWSKLINIDSLIKMQENKTENKNYNINTNKNPIPEPDIKKTFINRMLNKLPTLGLVSFVLHSYKFIKI